METIVRAAILTSVLILGFAPAAMAMPLAALPAAPDAIRVHGCHRHYAQDITGWHRHDDHCRSLRGLVGRKSRAQLGRS
jgi:hypothetical protein